VISTQSPKNRISVADPEI